MAGEFIGLQMVVTLRDPPERLCGTISGVEAGQSLGLIDVWSLDSNLYQPRVSIDPENIVDISDGSQLPNPTVTRLQPPSAPQQAPRPSAPAFTDPAILAIGSRPSRPDSRPQHESDIYTQSNTGEKRDPEPRPSPSIRIDDLDQQATPTVTELEAIERMTIQEKRTLYVPESPGDASRSKNPQHETQELGQKKKRRQRQPRQSRNGLPYDSLEFSPVAARTQSAGRGKGWRQTPILQDTASFQPFNSLKKKGNRGRPPVNQDNGWASEDVTDVQEMGDFDFEGSLAKFDKRTLFDQMRKDDQIDDAERLVSHNRQPKSKPGTAGGKNLHYSENVLDTPSTNLPKPQRDAQADFWNSEADDGVANDGGERLSGREHGSRQSSRRGESKISATLRSQSRKASATALGQGPLRVNSGVSVRSAQLRSRSRVASSSIDERHIKQLSSAGSAQGFYLVPSYRRLETVSALQMLNLENIAHNELGLTEDMMTENAGRGIAEVTLIALADPAIKLRTGMADKMASAASGPNNVPSSTVVVLAGNNKSGIRAIAAARHLRNKGITVLLCVVGIERGERELLEDMRQQVRLYRNFGGHVFTKGELFEHLRKVSIPTLTIDTPRNAVIAKPPVVTLIVDALLGLAISFDELRTGDQATVYELIEWANRNEAFVLAVDVPTGIDPSTGKPSIIDGNRLYVRPRYVVAIGAPKRGLLEVMSASKTGDNTASPAAKVSDDSAADWKLFVTDMGLGPAVWKKSGTKIRRGIDFDNKWVLEMKHLGAPADDEEYV